jgi:MFS superfamily sulfate permease-like transporter
MQKSGPLNIIKEAKHWKTDIPSGLVVFLVAIPLCLGIALASGSSAMSGIIAGIVGGLVVTLFSNSSLGVSGPAAGLVAIVAPAIAQLGFQNFLFAVVLAGVIQFVLGVLKAGTIGYYFPTSVIKGMLAAIGLIIILKQIPHALGYDKNPEGDLAFSQTDGYNTFNEIGHALGLITPSALIITLVCLAILIFWETKRMKAFGFTRLIQGPLVAVIAGILLNLAFSSTGVMKLDKDHLVQLPVNDQVALDELPEDCEPLEKTNDAGQTLFEHADGTIYFQDDQGKYVADRSFKFIFPHFSPSSISGGKMQFGHGHGEEEHAEPSLEAAGTQFEALEKVVANVSDEKVAASMAPVLADLRKSLAVSDAVEETESGVSVFRAAMMIFITALTLAIVASLESLLCAEATDKLDPKRRQTDLNQELRAQGIGNVVSGMVGGLPVTQVIVRSSTNIQSGGQSRFAAFVHGIFLIGCVIAIPHVLNLIPLASLAAILFVVGYKLAHPSKFKLMFSQGWTQFLPFIITIAAILRTDLLIGIGIGLIASLFFILKSSYFKSFWMTSKEENGKMVHHLTLAERMFFINKGNLQSVLQEIDSGSKVIIDNSNTVHMDQDVLDVFNDFNTHAEFDNIDVQWVAELGGGETKDPARVQDQLSQGA